MWQFQLNPLTRNHRQRELNKMNLPRFNAEATLYRTNRHYRFAATAASGIGGHLFPAIVKGTHCVPDPSCGTGFSKLFCPSFNADDCVETGICCTPPPPPPAPRPVNCGAFQCPPGDSCCGPGCCPSGTFCCGGEGCCNNGDHCRRIFGKLFCTII